MRISSCSSYASSKRPSRSRQIAAFNVFSNDGNSAREARKKWSARSMSPASNSFTPWRNTSFARAMGSGALGVDGATSCAAAVAPIATETISAPR
jgi:hypothetical protein